MLYYRCLNIYFNLFNNYNIVLIFKKTKCFNWSCRVRQYSCTSLYGCWTHVLGNGDADFTESAVSRVRRNTRVIYYHYESHHGLTPSCLRGSRFTTREAIRENQIISFPTPTQYTDGKHFIIPYVPPYPV